MNITLLKKEYAIKAAQILAEAYWDSIDKAKNELLKKIKSRECFVAIADQQRNSKI